MAPLNDGMRSLPARFYAGIQVLDQDDGFLLLKTPYGKLWSPGSTDIHFLLAEQELDVYRVHDAALGLREGDVVLDCGANVGVFVRQALNAGASHVVAIEISPRNIEALRRSFESEIAAGRVTVVPEGVWHEGSELELSVFHNSALDSVVMHDRVEGSVATTVTVPLTTIDAIVAELNLERVDFIKMDVEGAERNALRGGFDTLRRFRPRLAIAAENLLDDVVVVPQVVREAVGDYEMTIGECRRLQPFIVRPEVLHFR